MNGSFKLLLRKTGALIYLISRRRKVMKMFALLNWNILQKEIKIGVSSSKINKAHKVPSKHIFSMTKKQ